MARIGKGWTFEAAHRLLNHNGKCRNLHGHSYRVEIAIQGEIQEDVVAPSNGMVLDFGQLNDWWKPLEAVLDHTTILETGDPLVDAIGALTKVTQFSFPPTAENLAAWLMEELQMWLLTDIWPDQVIPSPTVRVYETAKSWAEG